MRDSNDIVDSHPEGPTGSIRVVLALDRAGPTQMRGRLWRYEDVELVGDVDDAGGASLKVTTLSPEVVLIDIDAPKMKAFETASNLRQLGYTGALIGISSYPDRLEQALESGMSGYMLKNAGVDEILGVIRQAPTGGFTFGASIMDTASGVVAFRYLATEVSTANKPSGVSAARPRPDRRVRNAQRDRSVAPPTGKNHRGSAANGPSAPSLATHVELSIEPPAQVRSLLMLQEWLKKTANVDVEKMSASQTEDTLIMGAMRQQIELSSMLAELPFVAEVTRRPDAAPADTVVPGGPAGPDRLTERLHLVFKDE